MGLKGGGSILPSVYTYPSNEMADQLSQERSSASPGALADLRSSRLAASECPDGTQAGFGRVTTVRLNVEENQLVNVFGEFGICLGGLKSA
jgi:hypothetical protein